MQRIKDDDVVKNLGKNKKRIRRQRLKMGLKKDEGWGWKRMKRRSIEKKEGRKMEEKSCEKRDVWWCKMCDRCMKKGLMRDENGW